MRGRHTLIYVYIYTYIYGLWHIYIYIYIIYIYNVYIYMYTYINVSYIYVYINRYTCAVYIYIHIWLSIKQFQFVWPIMPARVVPTYPTYLNNKQKSQWNCYMATCMKAMCWWRIIRARVAHTYPTLLLSPLCLPRVCRCFSWLRAGITQVCVCVYVWICMRRTLSMYIWI